MSWQACISSLINPTSLAPSNVLTFSRCYFGHASQLLMCATGTGNKLSLVSFTGLSKLQGEKDGEKREKKK